MKYPCKVTIGEETYDAKVEITLPPLPRARLWDIISGAACALLLFACVLWLAGCGAVPLAAGAGPGGIYAHAAPSMAAKALDTLTLQIVADSIDKRNATEVEDLVRRTAESIPPPVLEPDPTFLERLRNSLYGGS